MSVDAATWQALGLVLTLIGLGLSAVVWSRRGPARGLRGIAWSLVPLAAGLTGVLRLGWQVGDAVVQWAGRLVFSPTVWLGLLVAALSAVLFVVSGAMLRRRSPARGVPASGSPALPRTRSTEPAAPAGDDMADIEEILRKHGIQ